MQSFGSITHVWTAAEYYGLLLELTELAPGISEDKLLNSHFFRAGYRVYGAGKIYHGAADRGGEWTDYFPGQSKTERHPDAKDNGVGGIEFYPLANTDEELPDYGVVSYGLEKLNEKSDKPFFLAVGLVKPHMPFSVPKKWFDMFPLSSIQLPPHREDHRLLVERPRLESGREVSLAKVRVLGGTNANRLRMESSWSNAFKRRLWAHGRLHQHLSDAV